MATKIRLTRVGRKKVPFYHIVVADERSPRDGGFIEKLGYYNPLEGEKGNWNLKTDRVKYWLSTGAQPTSALARIFLSEVSVATSRKKLGTPNTLSVKTLFKAPSKLRLTLKRS